MIETIEYATAEYPVVTYARAPIPVAILDGVPWWSTAHIQNLVYERFNPSACEGFEPYHVRAHRFPFDREDELSHVISTEAAMWLTNARPQRKVYRMVCGWLRNRAAELRPGGVSEIPLLRVGDDGRLPREPDSYHAHQHEAWVHSLQRQLPKEYNAYLLEVAKREASRERYLQEERARWAARYPQSVSNPTPQG